MIVTRVAAMWPQLSRGGEHTVCTGCRRPLHSGTVSCFCIHTKPDRSIKPRVCKPMIVQKWCCHPVGQDHGSEHSRSSCPGCSTWLMLTECCFLRTCRSCTVHKDGQHTNSSAAACCVSVRAAWPGAFTCFQPAQHAIPAWPCSVILH